MLPFVNTSASVSAVATCESTYALMDCCEATLVALLLDISSSSKKAVPLIPVLRTGDVIVVVPVAVKVPPTIKLFPEPTCKPTLVPEPAATKIPSSISRSALSFVPQVSVDAPISGFVKFKLLVYVSAIVLSYCLVIAPIINMFFWFAVCASSWNQRAFSKLCLFLFLSHFF